jgi:hypothetical protein
MHEWYSAARQQRSSSSSTSFGTPDCICFCRFDLKQSSFHARINIYTSKTKLSQCSTYVQLYPHSVYWTTVVTCNLLNRAFQQVSFKCKDVRINVNSVLFKDPERSKHPPHSATNNTVIYSKAVPLQAWSGSEGSRKLRFPDYMTTAQDGGKVVSLKHRPPLPPGNAPGTHFC